MVLGLALLPALGNFAGGVVAELLPVSARNLNRALHAATGVVLAIVAVELIPRAIDAMSGWLVGVAFGIGGLCYVAMQQLVKRLEKRTREAADRASMWMVYLAVGIDLFSDGLMIGAGTAVASGLGLLLALGQVLADLPEGFATMANLRDKGVPRRRRLALAAAFALPAVGAAAFAYFVLRDQGPALQMVALTFTAGLLTVAAVEDMLTEAHDSAEDRSLSLLALIAGFVLFTFVSAGLGSGQ